MSVQPVMDATAPANVQPNQLNNTETAVEQKPKEDQLSPKFASLARKEKMLRDREMAFKAKEAEFEKQFQTKLEAERNSWKDQLKSNPLEVMQETGLSYDQLTQLMLNQPGPEAQKIAALEKKIAELEGKTESTTKTIQESQARQYEEAKKQIRNDVKAFVAKDETYEVIRSTESYDAVVELIAENFKTTGELMTVDEACKSVEEYLFEEGMKFASLNKVKAKLIPQAPTEPVVEKKPVEQKTSVTLSNRMVPATPTKMTSKERRERAIAAFLGSKQ